MKINPLSYVYLSILFFSLNPILTKYLLKSFPVFQLAAIRVFFISVIFFLIVCIDSNKFKFNKIGLFPFFLGIIEPGLNSTIFVYVLTLIDASNVILLISMLPLTQAIFGKIFLYEKIDLSIIFGSCISFVGVGIYLYDSWIDISHSLVGNLIMLYMFIILTTSQLLIRNRMKENINALHFTFVQFIGASLIVFILNVYSRETIYNSLIIDSQTILAVIFLCLSLGIPVLINNFSLKFYTASKLSLIYILVIPLGFIWSIIFLNEKMTNLKVTGTIVVVIGVLSNNIKFKNKKFKLMI